MPPKPHPTEIPTENFSDRNFSVQRVGRFGRQFALPTPLPFQSVGFAELAFIFRFFKAEEVELAAGVTGDDQLESIRICAAIRSAVAGEGGPAIAQAL